MQMNRRKVRERDRSSFEVQFLRSIISQVVSFLSLFLAFFFKDVGR